MLEPLITSLDDPRLTPYRDLKKTNLTRWSGWFVAEGEKVVLRLLESNYPVESVLVSEAKRDQLRPLISSDVPLMPVSEGLARELLGFQFHAGVLACGIRRPGTALSEWQQAVDGETSLLVACDRVTDPDNLGTIIRLCTAFGIRGLILGPGCADPFSRRTLRVSMGNAFFLPLYESRHLVEDLQSFRERGFRVLATMLHPRSRPLEKTPRPRKGIVLLGNESQGLSEDWLERSDEAVVIPMSSGTDSLNVGVAAGIVLHYLTRLADEAERDDWP
jgi:tRNA G18 (ribose-2'-O)-methylase SpoU